MISIAASYQRLLWLAESHQNYDIAIGPPPSGLEGLLRESDPGWDTGDLAGPGRLPGWASEVGFIDIRLEYEPRCLAVSPDGHRVAVGTKGGGVGVLSWEEGGWKHRRWYLEGRPAIRAIAFLDADTLVVGPGRSRLRVFDLSDREAEGVRARDSHGPPGAGLPGEEPGWLQRYRRFIRLRGDSGSGAGPLLIATTVGSRVSVLFREGDGYRHEAWSPAELVEGWSDGGRLIDGAWAGDRLWLLSSRGRLYPCRPGGARSRSVLVLEDEAIDLRHLRRSGEFRSLRSCVRGLGVLASNDITFLPFLQDGDRSQARVQPARARWVYIPDVMDFAICPPFYGRQGSGVDQSPVRVAVATAQAGLIWIAWPATTGEVPILPRVPSPHLAGTGSSSVLHLQFGWPGSARQDGSGPAYLVCATRDHRLRIASLIDRDQVQALLDRRLPAFLPDVAPASAGRHAAPDRAPSRLRWTDLTRAVAGRGVEWWLLHHRIRLELGATVPVEVKVMLGRFEIRGPELLGGVDEPNLKRVLEFILRTWHQTAAGRRDDVRFKRWIRYLLERAHQIDSRLARDIARRVYDAIAAARRGDSGACQAVWLQMCPFAFFLRKWILRGHTYSEKASCLHELYRLNATAGRSLDALAYLTRLIRKRVDLLWESSLASDGAGSSPWVITSAPGGGFALAAFMDGRIGAISSEGSPLTWDISEWEKRAGRPLSSLGLSLAFDGWSLQNAGAESFRQRYHHGPYARALLIQSVEIDRESSYLISFALKGWPPQDLDGSGDEEVHSRRPLLFALVVRPKVRDGAMVQLELVAAGVREVCNELYGLCWLSGEPGAADGRRRLVAGTRGGWQDEHGHWREQAFAEFEIGLAAPSLTLEERFTCPPSGLERTLQRRREEMHNPCWSLAVANAATHQMLWLGLNEGMIVCFRRSHGDVGWERFSAWNTGDVRQVDGAPLHGLRTSGPIWNLRYNPAQQLLAYGTRDGVMGVIALDDPGGHHLVHALEASGPVSGLVFYVDEGEHRLLALSQDGYATLFDMQVQDRPRHMPHSGRLLFPGIRLDRFQIRGSARCIDVMGSIGPESSIPTLLLGDADGLLCRYALAYPAHSLRRREAARESARLFDDALAPAPDSADDSPPLEASIGEDVDELHAWLRVMDVADHNLLRFSLWRELQRWGDVEPSRLQDPDWFQGYLALLEARQSEMYSRRPFSKEPVKILWEEGSRVANRMASLAIETNDPGEASRLLVHFHGVAGQVADMCNRWIGFNQSLEANMLIHSFKSLFDWPQVILIASLCRPCSMLREVQEFLLYKMVQRRLDFDHPVVQLEVLRVINVALLRAVGNMASPTGRGVLWRSGLDVYRPPATPSLPLAMAGAGNGGKVSGSAPAAQAASAGYYSLMTMVGALRSRRVESLSPTTPLYSEIVRFFALSLLFLPESSLVVGSVVRESGLLGPGSSMAEAIYQQAHALALTRPGIEAADPLLAAIELFRLSCDPVADFSIARLDGKLAAGDGKSAWSRLLMAANDVKSPDEDNPLNLTNPTFLREQRQVLLAAAVLAHLEERPLTDAQERALEWICDEAPSPPVLFFKHSRRVLRWLIDQRREVYQAVYGRAHAGRRLPPTIGSPSPGSAEESPAQAVQRTLSPLQQGIEMCRQLETQLSTHLVFEPQRSHYRQIIQHWRSQIEQRAIELSQLLLKLDRFNRHVYRMGTDELMSSLMELVMQTTPIWFGDTDGVPLRRQLEERLKEYPLIHEIFMRGSRLVDSTYLEGTLLAVARDALGHRHPRAKVRADAENSRPSDPGDTTLADLRDEMHQACSMEGLDLELGEEWSDELLLRRIPVPAYRAVWANIIHELATNAGRYGGRTGSGVPFRVYYLSSGAERTLVFAGSRPFVATLGARHRPVEGRWEGSLERLLELARRAIEEGERLADDQRSSGGMGLALVELICSFCGMRASTGLLDVSDPAVDPVRMEADELNAAPFCVRIAWTEAT